MRARRIRKSLRSILIVCEERFIAMQRSYRCLKSILQGLGDVNDIITHSFDFGDEVDVIDG